MNKIAKLEKAFLIAMDLLMKNIINNHNARVFSSLKNRARWVSEKLNDSIHL